MRATFPRFVDLEARHGSLIRGMWAAGARCARLAGSAFYSLAGGLGELVERPGRAPARGAPAGGRGGDALKPREGGWAWSDPRRRTERGRAQAVVVAVPAPARRAAPRAAVRRRRPSLLQSIPFASSATVALGYRREDVAPPPGRIWPPRPARRGPALHRVHVRLHEVPRPRARGPRAAARVPGRHARSGRARSLGRRGDGRARAPGDGPGPRASRRRPCSSASIAGRAPRRRWRWGTWPAWRGWTPSWPACPACS